MDETILLVTAVLFTVHFEQRLNQTTWSVQSVFIHLQL